MGKDAGASEGIGHVKIIGGGKIQRAGADGDGVGAGEVQVAGQAQGAGASFGKSVGARAAVGDVNKGQQRAAAGGIDGDGRIGQQQDIGDDLAVGKTTRAKGQRLARLGGGVGAHGVELEGRAAGNTADVSSRRKIRIGNRLADNQAAGRGDGLIEGAGGERNTGGAAGTRVSPAGESKIAAVQDELRSGAVTVGEIVRSAGRRHAGNLAVIHQNRACAVGGVAAPSVRCHRAAPRKNERAGSVLQ